MELHFAVAHHFEECAGVFEAVGDTDMDVGAVEIDMCLTDTFETAELVKLHVFEFLMSEELVCGTSSSLDNAAGDTEYHCRAC